MWPTAVPAKKGAKDTGRGRAGKGKKPYGHKRLYSRAISAREFVMERFRQGRRFVPRTLAGGLAGLALAACSSMPLFDIAADSMGFGAAKYPLSRADVELSPYAFMGARFGSTPWAVMALAYNDGADRQWMSADRVLVVTRYGRVVRTVGLPSDLGRLVGPEGDPLATGLHKISGEAGPFLLYIDLPKRNLLGVPIEVRYFREAEETIEVLDREHKTVRVREEVASRHGDWKATNRYWADVETGFVWRSIQQFTPDLQPMEIEILKPPA
jgi:hypothetical protein